ncbi:hypothetical protein Tco_1080911 [Tanacetum coccineum]|uniref:Uncharacterized protein n=1 Tax=Tanacetum coccineum TaxID=301880 RepID=A0ABQ5HX63_9ASTR
MEESNSCCNPFLKLSLSTIGNIFNTQEDLQLNSFHTKKVFANMKRAGKDFSGRITPLFDTMMVQLVKEMGEDSDNPTYSTPIPIIVSTIFIIQPKNDKPINKVQRQEQRFLKMRQSMRKVLDLQKAKDAQAKEITVLKKRIQRSGEFGVPEEHPKQREEILDDVKMPVEAKVDGKDEQSTKTDDSTAGKVVATAGDDTTTTRPKDKGVVVQEPSEFRVPQEIKPLSSKDKGKGIMIEPEKEREELTDEEKAKLFMELVEKRRKHFAALRAQEKRNRPPTKAQKRIQMSTYLNHIDRYTYKQLKGNSFDEIQKLFDKEIKRVNTFVAMGSEVHESKEKKEEGREETAKGSRKKMLGRKRAGKEHQKESSKKQKVEKKKSQEVKNKMKLAKEAFGY